MLRIHAEKYVELGEQLLDLKTLLDLTNGIQRGVDDDIDIKLYDALDEMAAICSDIGANESRKLFAERFERDQLPRNCEELSVLVEVLKNELQSRMFLHIPAADAQYYENSDLLTFETKIAFPQLTQEVRSAGNSYACGLPTACVFHCMRALEHGLRALAGDVGLDWQKEQWHTIIEQIESEIERARKSLPRGVAKDERLNGLSIAARGFFYFKDGWRNYVAHNRVNYEPAQAMRTLVHVCDFTDHLARGLGLRESQ